MTHHLLIRTDHRVAASNDMCEEKPSNYVPVEFELGFIEPAMIEPVASADQDGYVPLCAALHWIMTSQGVSAVAVDDGEAWQAACAKLIPLMQTGKVELTGLPIDETLAERIPGHALAVIRMISPGDLSCSEIFESFPHVACAAFFDWESWSKWANDKLYIASRPRPDWTHLQVAKRSILKEWPRPTPTIRSEHDCLKWLITEIKKSKDMRPKPKGDFWRDAKHKHKLLSKRQFLRAWNDAISQTGATAWLKAGRPPLKIKSPHQVKS